jgi:hypothetical protein
MLVLSLKTKKIAREVLSIPATSAKTYKPYKDKADKSL